MAAILKRCRFESDTLTRLLELFTLLWPIGLAERFQSELKNAAARMPELPDVEVYKCCLDANALHKVVEAVTVEATEISRGLSVHSLKHAFLGCRFERTRRHGKYLFVASNGRYWLVLDFGMTVGLSI